MKKEKLFSSLVTLAVSLSVVAQSIGASFAADGFQAWDYDAGPDPKTAMGKELIDLNAKIPYFPGIAQEVMGEQKFRPAFGPIPWRMRQEPNSVKILFIGQDGTHIAEAAGRPATAGFGGRAQDLAKYFGVDYSAAFINTYAFTIKGQYGSFQSPIVQMKGGVPTLAFSSFVDNKLWLLTQDQRSPIAQWRNGLIDWIIRNNRESLKMIVLFGGSSRDAMASYVESKGGKVGTRYSEADLANIRVPEMELESSGGNNEVPVPQTKDGKDLYSVVAGKRVNYSVGMDDAVKENPDHTAAKNALAQNLSKYIDQMAFSNGGVEKSGIVHPAQLGGYDIDNKMEINGRSTISLKGLKISNDLTINRDILVVQLPHPTALSMMKPDKASLEVGKNLSGFKPYVAAGWKIEADANQENIFAKGQPYSYRRADMGPEYYDFGAPASRMVNVSSASRMSGKPNVIIFGTRDKARFADGAIASMATAKPSKMPASEEMFTARPRSPSTRYTFDAGPGAKYARIMKENIPASLIAAHPVNRDFGHYRGTFVKPQVVVLADPDGYDDLITARALTGTRGQYLNGLMEDLGVKDQYLVLKTAPFEIGADWETVLTQTQKYREAVLKAVFADGKPKVLVADGKYAAAEIDRIFGANAGVPVVKIERAKEASNDGIVTAGDQIKQVVPEFRTAQISGRMSDIPRSHMTYYARVWEGTSGDRVVTSTDAQYQGKAFAEVAPMWATSQKFQMGTIDQQGVKALIDVLESSGLRKGGEKIPSFFMRTNGRGALFMIPSREEMKLELDALISELAA